MPGQTQNLPNLQEGPLQNPLVDWANKYSNTPMEKQYFSISSWNRKECWLQNGTFKNE